MYLRNAKYVYHYLLFIYKPDTIHRVLTDHYFSTKRTVFGIVVLLMLFMSNKKVTSVKVGVETFIESDFIHFVLNNLTSDV